MDNETITITRKEYNELKHDQLVLRALEMGGVDNWEWYDLSMDNLEELERKSEEKNNN